LYHFVTSSLLLAALVGGIINLLASCNAGAGLYSASLIVALNIALIFVWYFARAFALKAQDRAIRAEENFRHFLLTGKPLDSSLRVSQITALRFASDEEFPALAAKAATENLGNTTIKQLIQHWRADHDRV
jgi:Family of unknown function (DUF6526)